MTEENKRPVEATEEVQYNDNHDASSKKPKFEILSAPPSIEPAENERLEALWREISSNPTKRKYDPQQTSTGRQNASAVDSNGEKAPAASTSAGDKAKKKKVALYMSYSGTGYVGMQINPGVPTIELDLLKALAISGATSADNAMDMVKIGFVRAARTDKGVHALGQMVSLKMILDEGVIERLNAALPPQIRVWGYTRVNNNFNAKNVCDSRIYEYMFPTHVLHLSRPDLYVNAPGPGSSVEPHVKATLEELGALKDYRATPDQVTHLRDILKEYIGTKNHHNFTVGKKFADKSAMRHIKSFDCSEPFMRRGLEWISCKVHGQSFMLHQIRKMMGLALLMVRTRTPASLMTQVFQATKMNIPRAPALGLLLDRTVYEAYNDRIKNLPAREEGRAPLTFEPFSKDIQAFKEAWVYETMVQEELDKGVFDEWTRAVDERPGDYAWYLNANGVLQEERRPEMTHASAVPEDEE